MSCSESKQEFLLGGIQVNEPDMGRWHRELLREGFNSVSLTTYARQGVWDTAQIEFPDAEGSGLVREMRAAKGVGLSRVLVLRVALDHAHPENQFLWHGMIMPRTESELDAWFYRYSQFVLQWADVAQREGVEVLGIGSELSSLTRTLTVDELPGLERYYLDRAAQEREQSRLLSAATKRSIPVGVLSGEGWQPSSTEGVATPDELQSFFDAREAAHVHWARQVTGEGSVQYVNRRRAALRRNWRRLIEEVRERYSGKVTYAANFDQVHDVAFWEALDVIGVNAYFPLREDLAPEHDQAALTSHFRSRWRDVLADLDDLRRDRGLGDRPLLFTEIGYTRRRGSTVQPWAGTGVAVVPEPPAGPAEDRLVIWQEQEEAPEERAMAISALGAALREIPDSLLMGVLYWKLSTVPEHQEIEPFVVLLGSQDPALDALRSLR